MPTLTTRRACRWCSHEYDRDASTSNVPGTFCSLMCEAASADVNGADLELQARDVAQLERDLASRRSERTLHCVDCSSQHPTASDQPGECPTCGSDRTAVIRSIARVA